MKVTISERGPDRPTFSYPALLRNKADSKVVVLMTSPGVGMRLCPKSGFLEETNGYTPASHWEPFIGTIGFQA